MTTPWEEELFWMSGLGKHRGQCRVVDLNAAPGKFLSLIPTQCSFLSCITSRKWKRQLSPYVTVLVLDFCTGPCKEALQNQLFFVLIFFFLEICWILNISLPVAEPLQSFVLSNNHSSLTILSNTEPNKAFRFPLLFLDRCWNQVA